MKKYILCILLIILGLGIFIYPKFSNYINNKNEAELINTYKNTVENMNEEKIKTEYQKAKEYNEYLQKEMWSSEEKQKFEEEYDNILNVFSNKVMAYIEIPKISVKLPIYNGTNDNEMKKGVGHLKNSSLPIGGSGTHCILTGHTGLTKAEIFTRLNELNINDYFYIEILGEKLIYKVYQIKTVLPTELEDLQIVENKDLVTLVTCTPYGVNTHRLLVQGERVIDEEIKDIKEEIENSKDNAILINKEKLQEIFIKEKYYFLGFTLGILILTILIFSCILIKKIVKYFKKKAI